MSSVPIVSIIVPCYNQAKYLPETLDCILAQTFQDWECILVNDGSTDDTEKVALEYCDKENRFHYFYKENSGVSDTRNYGVSKSQGKYILPLDSDDIVGEGYLEDAVKVFESNKEVDVVYSEGVFFDGLVGKIELKPYAYQTLLLENTFFCPVFFKRENFDRVGGYNVNMKKGWEDWELMISLLDENSVVVKIPKVYYHYRILANSRERSITLEQKAELFMQIYENHKDIYKKFFPNEAFYLYLYNQQVNENERLQKSINSIQNSKKYRLVQKIAKLKLI